MKNLAPLLLTLCLVSCLLIDGARAGVSREQMEKMANGFRNTCVGKTGADMSLVEGIRVGNFVEDPTSMCYTKCIMGLMKTFTKQGSIDVEMLVKQINVMASPDIAGSMVTNARKCHAETSASDPCELAWLFTKCIYAADPAVYFFP
ncbi:hypothetical protein TSAR_007536 [Trichomalopsis sarcophagae]|uniref:Uncharacterized protein n=1 Tax=Trichomalopsis sarcophagae TaxID=543379 RepID=A0A232F0E1_9HYME|nr:hypothetical protein TSAR_007536 [Trichomalopsis sarcophagae]